MEDAAEGDQIDQDRGLELDLGHDQGLDLGVREVILQITAEGGVGWERGAEVGALLGGAGAIVHVFSTAAVTGA